MNARSIVPAAVAVAVAVCLAVLVGAAPAVAHETNEVGALAVEIGWGVEPAYVGQLNSVQVIVTHKADGDPIEDAGADLKATVAYGDEQVVLGLEPNFQERAGEYRALLIPTAPGDYTFQIRGTVDGQKVDEKVTSSPDTFSPVEAAAAVQFPVKEPSTAEIAARLDSELARVAAQGAEAAGAVSGPSQAEVDSARTMGLVGVAVGAAGVVLAVVALLVRRRTA